MGRGDSASHDFIERLQDQCDRVCTSPVLASISHLAAAAGAGHRILPEGRAARQQAQGGRQAQRRATHHPAVPCRVQERRRDDESAQTHAIRQVRAAALQHAPTDCSLMTASGQERVELVPGRHACECLAVRHTLINNCTGCGRIVCQQEGAGPCLFCGELGAWPEVVGSHDRFAVATKEHLEALARDSRKGQKLRDKLMAQPVADDSALLQRARAARSSLTGAPRQLMMMCPRVCRRRPKQLSPSHAAQGQAGPVRPQQRGAHQGH